MGFPVGCGGGMAREGERELYQNGDGGGEETPTLREQQHIPRRPGRSEIDGFAVLMQMMAENQAKLDQQRREDLERQEDRRREDLERQEAKMNQQRKEDIERQQAEWERKEKERDQKRIEEIDRLEKKEIEKDRILREHQLLMLTEQQKGGERMAGTYREAQSTERMRHEALCSVPQFKEGQDLEEFLQIAEKRLLQGKVEEKSWVAIIAAKLTGRLSMIWLDRAEEEVPYEAHKQEFLRTCGFTPKIAGETFFGFSLDQCQGITAEQLFHRGQRLFRRMNYPVKPDPNLEFTTLLAWVYHLVPKRAKMVIDTRVVTCANELIGALADFLMLEGDKKEGVAATFGQLSLGGRKEFTRGSCFNCGIPGHRASECRKEKGSAGYSKPWNKEERTPYKVICFICQEEGHKAPQCPKKMVKEEPKSEGARTRPLNRLKVSKKPETELPGKVNESEVVVLLDSGANISVIPKHLVFPEQYTGETIWVRPFKAKETIACPMAKVPFVMGGMQWEEEVAVDEECGSEEGEVLYSLDIRSARGLQLIVYANQSEEEATVRKVTTRAEAKEQKEKDESTAIIVAKEKPKVRAYDKGEQAKEDDEIVVDTMAVVQPRINNEQLKKALQDLVGEKESDTLNIPPVLEKGIDIDRLGRLTEEDESLKTWKEKANKTDSDFAWGQGLLFQITHNQLEDEVQLLVLPQPLRKQVMQLAHEGMGHMSQKRVMVLVKQKFVWPGMRADIRSHCESCKECQKCQKRKAGKAPLMPRPVLSEPFEALAFDLVGPMEPGEGGCRFILTAICMASRWPEAIPLRTVTAEDVAEGMFQVFARTGLPLQLLSDQGPQFLSALVKSMCSKLKIDKIRTTPYHPECNGMIERMHGTLNSMLSKASAAGLDWVKQIPFALFALRLAPNRDTGFSPFQLVYGRQVRSPLDVLYEGWVEVEYSGFDVEKWTDWLGKRMEIWREVAREKGLKASAERKLYYDKHAVARTLSPGDKVLCRIPGTIKKLKESWKGPYTVKQKLNDVDYLIEIRKGKTKVLHINMLKQYKEREEQVRKLTVVAEDVEEDPDLVGVRLGDRCLGFDDSVIDNLKAAYPKVFSDKPGRTDLCQLMINTVSEQPLAAHPHRVPDKWKQGVREEIQKLEGQGIIVRSTGPWASPIVPVPKPDGSVRICVDYRRLNSITIKDPYYMVTLEEILDRVGNSGVMSKIDLSKGYYQIAVHPQSIEKTTFVCFAGKFSFTRMPFGLANAPAIFQRVMESVLGGCYDFSAPYIDDVLVFSACVEEHVLHLEEVIRTLGKAGLTVKISKSEFGRKSVEYLGHRIGGGFLAVPRHRITAMENYILPKTKKQLRSFLGAASYYRQFVYQFAWYSSSLSPSTSATAPAAVDWDEDKLGAFNHLKMSLCNMCLLTIPSSEDVFSLHTDASSRGIGATLNVTREGKEATVAFFSRQLHGAQTRYSATELEALAILRSVFFFAHFLHGRHFTIMTDHMALTSLMTSTRLNRRLQSWALKLMDFDFSICYKPGNQVGDADSLSRQDWPVELAETGEDTSRLFQSGGDVGVKTPQDKEGGAEHSPNQETDYEGTDITL